MDDLHVMWTIATDAAMLTTATSGTSARTRKVHGHLTNPEQSPPVLAAAPDAVCGQILAGRAEQEGGREWLPQLVLVTRSLLTLINQDSQFALTG